MTTHTIQFLPGKPRPFLDRRVTPICVLCGVLGGEMAREDAAETKREHLRDVRPLPDDSAEEVA